MSGLIALLKHFVRNTEDVLALFRESFGVRARPRAALVLGGGRIDDRADLGNPVCGKAALSGVFANQFLAGRDIDAVNPIVHHVAFDPLNLWSEVA